MNDVPPANEAIALNPIKVFISYSHKDDDLREEFDTHLANLKRQEKITAWHDRAIEAGSEWEAQIKEHLESAQIILLLISPDFMASDYCHDIEMQRAIKRHDAGTARVIPIILRPTDWEGSPFSKLNALPKSQPVTKWEDKDSAFLNVVEGIRKAVDRLTGFYDAPKTVREVEVASKKSSKKASLNNFTTTVLPIIVVLLIVIFFIYSELTMKSVNLLIREKKYEECLTKLNQNFLLHSVTLNSRNSCYSGLIEQARKIFDENNNDKEAIRLLGLIPENALFDQGKEARKNIVDLKHYREAKEAEGKCDWVNVKKNLEKMKTRSQDVQDLLDEASRKINTGEASIEKSKCPSERII